MSDRVEDPGANPVSGGFAVFLSHNSREKPTVRRIAEKLKQVRLEPWFDEWYLIGGTRWQGGLAEGLRASSACAVFIGPQDLGDWQREELDVAQERAAKDRNFRLIPVLLPGLPTQFDPNSLPPFLSTRTWVDFRNSVEDRHAFQSLVCAIKGIPPVRANLKISPTDTVEPGHGLCPYRGLQSFDENDADFFFGRDGDTQRLIEKLKGTRFLAVVGPSGSGKSSLVRAGLIPALRKGGLAESNTWKIQVFTPGPHPLEKLAAYSLRLCSQGGMQRTLDQMNTDQRTLHLAASLALANRPDHERILWVVDQFEEIFTLCGEESERAQFLANLLYASFVPNGRSVVVLTLRADFYPKCALYPQLSAKISAQQFLVGPMDRQGLRQVIEQPAWRVGLDFEPGLVDAILNGVANQPGALPLLEYALFELCRRRSDNLLTLDGYIDSGGVEGAVAKSAEDIYTNRFNADQQAIAKRILLRLTQPGEDSEGAETVDTRRRARMSELITVPDEEEAVEAVVRALADARLLTTSIQEAGEREVDVSHEALIRNWLRLRNWLDEERKPLRIHRRLTEGANDWQRLNQDGGALYRGARLAEAIEWRPRIEANLNNREREFIDASVALEKRERLGKRRNFRLTVGGLLIVLVIISLLAVVAFRQRNAAFRTISRDLAANAISQAEIDPELSILLAVEAIRIAYTEKAEDALRQALAQSHVTATMRGHRSDVVVAAFSPNGQLVVTLSMDNSVRVWRTSTGQTVCELSGHSGLVNSVAFSPDSKLIVTASGDKTARVWEATTGRVLTELRGHQEDVRTAVFNRDGTLIVTAGGGVTKGTGESWQLYRTKTSDYTARVWDATSGHFLIALSGHTGPIYSAEFSPDGQFIVTASLDKTARVWDVRSGRSITELIGHLNPLRHAAFSHDSKLVLTSSEDDKARVWEASTGKLLVELPAQRSSLPAQRSSTISAAFSPDGNLVVTTYETGKVVVWRDWKTGNTKGLALGGHEARVESVQFSSDGSLVATAGDDRTVRIWETNTGILVAELRGHSGTIWGASFAPDDKSVITASADRTARVWRVSGAPILKTLEAPKSWPTAFSPDSKLVITTSEGTARIWDASNASVVAELSHSVNILVSDAAFSPDSKLVVTASWDGTARVWAADTGKALLTFQEGQPLNSVAFSSDGKFIVTGAGSTAQVWDASTGHPVTRLSGHISSVRDATFSPDGELIVTASDDTTVRVWDAKTGQSVAELEHGVEAGVNSAVFSPDGRFIVTASDDKKARIWNWATRNVIELIGHTAAVSRASFSSSGKCVFTASGDGTARVWKAETGQNLAMIHGYHAIFSPNAKLIAVAWGDGTPNGVTTQILVCDFCGPVKELLELAPTRVTRQLTAAEREIYLPKL